MPTRASQRSENWPGARDGSNMTAATYLPIGSLAFAALGFVALYFGFVLHVREDISTIMARCEHNCRILETVPQIEAKLATLTANNAVFWKVLEPHLAGIIHSPVHKDRDFLVDEFMGGRLSGSDLLELHLLLTAMLTDENEPAKRLAAALLLARVEAQIAAGQHSWVGGHDGRHGYVG
jgi:hypothetical protein